MGKGFVLMLERRWSVGVLPALLAACHFTGLACAADQRSPILLSLAFSPQSISTAEPTRVTISFAATAESGIAYFEAVFVDPTGTVRRSASAKFPPAPSVMTSVGVDFYRFENPGVWTLAQ